MRHVLLALMIALLPLRAWLGDSMALAAWDSGIASPVAQADAHQHSHGSGPAGGPAEAEPAPSAAGLLAEATANGPAHTDTALSSAMTETADTADMVAMADCHGPGSDSDSDSGGHSHKLCDLCNGPALVQPTAAIAAAAARDRLLIARHERFLSAEPQPGQKPPIA